MSMSEAKAAVEEAAKAAGWVDALPEPETVAARLASVLRLSKSVYPDMDIAEGQSLIDKIMKARPKGEGVSRQAQSTQQPLERPFDFGTTKRLKLYNVHHSTCLEAKKSAVFMGWKDKRVAETLDPLCAVSFYGLMGEVGADYVSVANGYIEVVLEGNKATGLHHIKAEEVTIVLETDSEDQFTGDFHYEVLSGDSTTGVKVFAAYGDRDDLFARAEEHGIQVPDDIDEISEVIHLKRPNEFSTHYGVPGYLAATAAIELVQAMTQHYYDFFLNRGVPEFMIFFLGAVMPDKDWAKVEAAMQGNIGLGNAFKSLALNLANPNLKVQLEKLAMESKAENLFPEVNDTMALQIVSAHQVPPLLAGIVIPGKLGANNELPNALMAFQVLTVGPEQRNVCSTFAGTIGNKTISRGIDLDAKAFLGSAKDKGNGMHKITEEIDLGTMDTVGRMKEPVASANAKGRDVKQGLKD